MRSDDQIAADLKKLERRRWKDRVLEALFWIGIFGITASALVSDSIVEAILGSAFLVVYQIDKAGRRIARALARVRPLRVSVERAEPIYGGRDE